MLARARTSILDARRCMDRRLRRRAERVSSRRIGVATSERHADGRSFASGIGRFAHRMPVCSLTSWILGYPERAIDDRKEACDIASEKVASHGRLDLCALLVIAVVNLRIGDRKPPARKPTRLSALIHEHGLMSVLDWLGFGAAGRSHNRGTVEEGITEMLRSRMGCATASGDHSTVRIFCGVGRALSGSRPPRRGTHGGDDALRRGSSSGRTIARGRTASTQRRVAIAAVTHDAAPKPLRCFAHAIEIARTAERQILGIARDDEPRAAARNAGQPRRGARDARRNLQLVHRGLRHRRPQRRQGPARRTGRDRRDALLEVRRGQSAGAKFCGECGESLAGRCPKCGLANPAERKVLRGMRHRARLSRCARNNAEIDTATGISVSCRRSLAATFPRASARR